MTITPDTSETEVCVNANNTISIEEKNNDNSYLRDQIIDPFFTNTCRSTTIYCMCVSFGMLIMCSAFAIVVMVLIIGIILTVTVNENFFVMVLLDCVVGVPLLIAIISLIITLFDCFYKCMSNLDQEVRINFFYLGSS